MLSRRSLILRGMAALAAAPLALVGRPASAGAARPKGAAKPRGAAAPKATPAEQMQRKARPIWIGHR